MINLLLERFKAFVRTYKNLLELLKMLLVCGDGVRVGAVCMDRPEMTWIWKIAKIVIISETYPEQIFCWSSVGLPPIFSL